MFTEMWFRQWSCGLLGLVVFWWHTNISEGHAASIYMVRKLIGYIGLRWGLDHETLVSNQKIRQ